MDAQATLHVGSWMSVGAIPFVSRLTLTQRVNKIRGSGLIESHMKATITVYGSETMMVSGNGNIALRFNLDASLTLQIRVISIRRP